MSGANNHSSDGVASFLAWLDKAHRRSDTQSRKPYDTGRPKISIGVNNMNYQAPKIEWQEPKNNEVIYPLLP